MAPAAVHDVLPQVARTQTVLSVVVLRYWQVEKTATQLSTTTTSIDPAVS